MLDADGHKNDREDMDLAFEELCNNHTARLKKKKKLMFQLLLLKIFLKYSGLLCALIKYHLINRIHSFFNDL